MDISSYEDDHLLNIVGNPDGWQPDYVKAAKEELTKRGFSVENIAAMQKEKEAGIKRGMPYNENDGITGRNAAKLFNRVFTIKESIAASVQKQIIVYIVVMIAIKLPDYYMVTWQVYIYLFSGDYDLVYISVKSIAWSLVGLGILYLLWLRNRPAWAWTIASSIYLLWSLFFELLLLAQQENNQLQHIRPTLAGSESAVLLKITTICITLYFFSRKKVCRHFRLTKDFAYGVVIVGIVLGFIVVYLRSDYHLI